jgi:DNA-binding transcriptional LysR family regulator
MDRLTSMEVFSRVVDAESFSEAARQLGMSRAMVSKHVLSLEDRLGARLLNRTTRRLSLTEVGAAYHERCKRIVSDAQEAEDAAGRLHAEPRGRLKVNAPMAFGIRHLAPAIPEFLERYPEVEIEMSMTDRFVDLIEEGYDVAVRIGRLAESSLIARRIAPIRNAVCGTPQYFEAHGTPKTPDDLVDHRCLIYTYPMPHEVWRFTGADRDYAVPVTGNFRVNNGDALRAAALRGLGIAILPTFIVGGDLRSGALRAVLTEFRSPDAAVYAVYPHSRHLSTKVRSFVDFLAARFGPSPYWENAADGTDASA